MAREFDGSTQFIEAASAVLSGVPLTMACWLNSDSITDNQTVIQIADASSSVNYFSLQALGGIAGDPIRGVMRQSGAINVPVTSTGYLADTWHHICAVFAAADSGAVYIDGGSKGTDTATATPTNLDITSLGVRNTGGTSEFTDGEIAEVAIWNVALTDAEVAQLAAGYSPRLVRPQGLVLYMPLVRELHDIVGRIGMTNTGTTVSDHPPIIYPISPQIEIAVAAIPPVAIASSRLKIGHGR